METGNYEIKLNYVSGTEQVTATVIVNAGPEYYKRTVILSSDDTSVLESVCTVQVSNYGNYDKFNIIPASPLSS